LFTGAPFIYLRRKHAQFLLSKQIL